MRLMRLFLLADRLVNCLIWTQLYCGTYRGYHPRFLRRTANRKGRVYLSRYDFGDLKNLLIHPGRLELVVRRCPGHGPALLD